MWDFIMVGVSVACFWGMLREIKKERASVAK